MNIALIILAVFVATLVGTVLMNLIFKKRNNREEIEVRLMMDQIEKLRQELNRSSADNRREIQGRLDVIDQNMSKTMHHQFSQTSNIIQQISTKMAEVHETNKQVVGFAEQMKSLENILKNPKQRGILGEYFLETLLSNILSPKNYKMQYQYKNGIIVDAAIFYNDKIIPVDAKFSLEKYNKIMEEKSEERRDSLEKEFKQDIKNRIDETSKYIMASENTTDFAFMFIPAEGIYYNLLIYQVGTVSIKTIDLIEYAFKKRVIIVSPTSFYAYLQTVMQGLKALKMEESVKEIIKRIYDLDKHLDAFEGNYKKVGNALSTTVNMYNTSSKEFKKVDKDIYKLTDGTGGNREELLSLDKPSDEDE